MSYEVYRVRRKFQYSGFVYAPVGPCECSRYPGSSIRADRLGSNGKAEDSVQDSNICHDTKVCRGSSAQACTCPDSGYCGMGGGYGACGIKPWQYGGDIWLVQAGDPRKLHILARRFVIYDPTLPAAEELLKQERYKILVQGEPTPGKVWFLPQESIKAPAAPAAA